MNRRRFDSIEVQQIANGTGAGAVVKDSGPPRMMVLLFALGA